MTRDERMLERNFDRIGHQVPLPAEPSDEQVARWTGGSSGGATRRRNRTMLRKLFVTGGFGIAAAAAIVFTMLAQSPSVASAAQIFAEARSAIERLRLARIEFRDVVWKHYRLNLTAHVAMNESGELESARIQTRNENVPFGYDEPDFSIQWDMEGSDHEHTFVSSPTGAWSYLKLTRLAEDFAERNPDANLLAPLVEAAKAGAYVDRQRRLGGKAVWFTANLNVIGLADREKFSKLVRAVEQKAAVIEVEHLDGGRMVLRASDYQGRTGEVFQLFTWQGRQDDLIDEIFSKAIFEVTIGKDGIEKIRITNVAHGGEIEASFDERINDFDATRLMQVEEMKRVPGEVISAELLRKLKPGGRKE
ncbi:MAG: hypothetical protein ACKVS9_04600 [Phycisphaerae bacterium]